MFQLIYGIGYISAERYSRNEAGSALPEVLPHELAKLRDQDFRIIVCTYRDRLLTRWSYSKIDRIEHELEELIFAHQSKEAFKKSLDEYNCSMGFRDGWSNTGGRFTVLREFCGGLATVFPGTDMVESKFSIVKYVKNDFRTSFT